MNLREILDSLDEEVITIEKAKELISKEADVPIENLTDVEYTKFKSISKEYEGIGNLDFIAMQTSEYRKYLGDLVGKMFEYLPQGFEKYFNTEEFINDMINDVFVVKQVQDFLDDKGDVVDSILAVHPTDTDCYILEVM